jgi:hypothetical protein
MVTVFLLLEGYYVGRFESRPRELELDGGA